MRKGWKIKKLNEVSTISYGYTDSASSNDIGPKFLRITDIQNNSVDWDTVPYCKCKKDELLKYKLEDGDIVFARTGATTGKSFLIKQPPVSVFASYLIRLKIFSKDELLPEFVALYFQTKDYWSRIKAGVSGSAQGGFNATKLGEIIISLPPLSEQKRIVSILDRAFAAIDKAKANTEKNLQNAKALFESYLQGVFEERGKDWVKETLEDLLRKQWIVSHLDGNHGSEYPRKEEFKESGVPYISANCIRGDSVDFSLSKFLSKERASAIRKGIAINNDVLFAHNATVGPVALLKANSPMVILGTSLTYYRCNTDFILPEYLAHYMRSKVFKEQYEIIMRQSTRNQVPITKQREFYHIIPPIKVQKELIKKLEYLHFQSQKLQKNYQERLTSLDELKKSILQKAFAGELKTKEEIVI